MRRRLLSMWLALALRAMERAAGFSAELLADKAMDDLALSWRILFKAVYGRPAPKFKGIITGGLVDSTIESWEWAHGRGH